MLMKTHFFKVMSWANSHVFIFVDRPAIYYIWLWLTNGVPQIRGLTASEYLPSGNQKWQWKISINGYFKDFNRKSFANWTFSMAMFDLSWGFKTMDELCLEFSALGWPKRAEPPGCRTPALRQGPKIGRWLGNFWQFPWKSSKKCSKMIIETPD